jgi:hypothetical protein
MTRRLSLSDGARPSLAKMLATCFSTTLGEITRMAAAGMKIETKSSAPSSAEIIDWATVFGILLALGLLAPSVALIRSESAPEPALTASGAPRPSSGRC